MTFEPRKRVLGRVPLVFLCILFLASASAQAVVIQLNSFAEFISPTIYSNDFESNVIDVYPFTFDPTAFIVHKDNASGGVTSSGDYGLAEWRANEPLSVQLAEPSKEVGMFFGNDDFELVFNANLSVFNAANTLLGTVQVLSNANDWADQFIGLRSTEAFTRVEIAYEREAAEGLAIFIDDFTVGVPEPGTILLLGLGLGVVGLLRRRR